MDKFLTGPVEDAIGDEILHRHFPAGQSVNNKLCSKGRKRAIPDSSCHLPPGQKG